jgi:predicted permease
METAFVRLLEVERERHGAFGTVRVWLGAVSDGIRNGWMTSLAAGMGPLPRREMSLWGGLWNLWQDVRHALRGLRRQPMFAAVAALSLAIGVGANAAVFNAASALLLRPIAGVDEPERLVEIIETRLGPDRDYSSSAYLDFVDLRAQADAFDAVAGYSMEVLSYSGKDGGERVMGFHVSADYFRLFGLEPARGRFILPEEDRRGAAAPVAVLSHRFWRNRLGADPDVIGSTIRLNRMPFQVVGIAPEDFTGHVVAVQPDVFVPLHASTLLGTREPAAFENRLWGWLYVVARLAPGVTLQQGDAQVKAVHAGLREAHPESNANRSGMAVSLGLIPQEARDPVRAFMAVLGAMVGLVLIVTCANVAGMLVARNGSRQKEMAVRLSLGSGRSRLVRLLLTEALVIFVLGGAIGTAIGLWLLGAAPLHAVPLPMPMEIDLSPDPRVLLFAIALTLSVGVVFAMLPALQATRVELATSLKDQGGPMHGAGRLRRMFASGQVGLALVLLVCAGLFLRALGINAAVDQSFDATDTFRTGVDASLDGYDRESAPEFQRRLVERLEAIPGVASAALSDDLPLDLSRQASSVAPEGWSGPNGTERILANHNVVTPRYFETLRIPTLQGRVFADADARDAEPVMVVSRSFADRVWPGESVLGRRVSMIASIAGPAESRTVVGVVEDVRTQYVAEPLEPTVYLPLSQVYRGQTNVIAWAPGSPDGIAPAIREAILEVDPQLSTEPVIELARYTSLGVLPQRIAAGIASTLGLLAALLAGLGVYGVVAFLVTQRKREIAVRMALGAERGSVLRMIVRDGVKLALPGVAVGLAAAVGVGYVLRFLLLGISPFDPVTFAGVAFGVGVVIVVASVVPGRRAAALQPMEGLRT